MAVCKLDSLDMVLDAICQARDYATAHGLPLTIERVCACLGIGRQTLLSYINGNHVDGTTEDDEHDSIRATLKNVYLECNASLIEHGLTPKVNPAMPIFCAKNNYGYVDKVEQDISARVVVFDRADDLPE